MNGQLMGILSLVSGMIGIRVHENKSTENYFCLSRPSNIQPTINWKNNGVNIKKTIRRKRFRMCTQVNNLN